MELGSLGDYILCGICSLESLSFRAGTCELTHFSGGQALLSLVKLESDYLRPVGKEDYSSFAKRSFLCLSLNFVQMAMCMCMKCAFAHAFHHNFFIT